MAVAEVPLSLSLSGQNLLADDEEELFDIVDEDNQVVGRERRSVVHATGLKHRAVYCFVFDGQGQLLMQQRSPRQVPAILHVLAMPLRVPVSGEFDAPDACKVFNRKKIGPLQWDLSVAEHLQPGESYIKVMLPFHKARLHSPGAMRLGQSSILTADFARLLIVLLLNWLPCKYGKDKRLLKKI